MFAQEDTFADYMDAFFAENPNPSVAWIHDLGRGRYGAVSHLLLNESQKASELETKHVQSLSISYTPALTNFSSSCSASAN